MIHKVRCIDAKYDEEDGLLVLSCEFENGEDRIVVLKRDDFHYRHNPVPHIEMHRTAQLFKGKTFNLDVTEGDAGVLHGSMR